MASEEQKLVLKAAAEAKAKHAKDGLHRAYQGPSTSRGRGFRGNRSRGRAYT